MSISVSTDRETGPGEGAREACIRGGVRVSGKRALGYAGGGRGALGCVGGGR